MEKLRHPNIVHFEEAFFTKSKTSLCIVMQYCDGGDLSDQIKRAKNVPFREGEILHWFVQIGLGLHHMHMRKIMHRDLKSQNIFLLGNGRLVLGDLGIAKVLDGTMAMAQTCIGTPYYMAPEIFQERPYGFASDMWALGCILYEMCQGCVPFEATNMPALMKKIMKGEFKKVRQTFSNEMRALVSSLINVDVIKRPNIVELLKSQYLQKHMDRRISQLGSIPQGDGEGTRSMPIEVDAVYEPPVGLLHSAGENLADVKQRMVMEQTLRTKLRIEELLTPSVVQ